MRKLLGILGGMGPQASSSFYQYIINHTNASKDQEHIDIILYSHASIPDRTTAIKEGNSEILDILKKDLIKLESFGSDFIAITCNTSHYFIDKLRNSINIPIVSIVDETVEYLKNNGIKKIGLMATDGTLNTRIYTDKLEKNGISVVAPSNDKQIKVMDIIYKYIKSGIEFDNCIFDDVVNELKSHDVEKIILGCTELSYYGEVNNLDEFYINPQEILAKKCIVLCNGELI